jgi:hypothetical protein
LEIEDAGEGEGALGPSWISFSASIFEDTDMGDWDMARRWFVLNKEAYKK